MSISGDTDNGTVPSFSDGHPARILVGEATQQWILGGLVLPIQDPQTAQTIVDDIISLDRRLGTDAIGDPQHQVWASTFLRIVDGIVDL